MIDHPPSELLLSFIWLLALVVGIAWCLIAHPLRVAPKASFRFFAANLALGCGIYLLTLRTPDASLLNWFLADMAILISFMLIGWGIQQLFKLQSSVKRDCLILLLTAVLMLAGQLQQPHPLFLGLVFSITATLFAFSASRNNYQAIKKDFGFPAACLMSAPLFVITIIFFARTLILLWPEPQADVFVATYTDEAMPLLWSYAVLTLAINIMMVGGALARLVAKIRQFAERDQLTGLWNRRAALKKLQEMHEQWQKQQQSYSLILLDLDHFKLINDSLGHDAGDATLRRCATTLSAVVRTQDLVSRYGGEEFLLLFPGVSAIELPLIAEKIRFTLSGCQLIWQNNPIELSASLGYITVYPGAKAEHLLTLADQAMYQAKAEGRNKACAAVMS
ncbi:MAG: GGDEF domain-containing protein [Gammaproteobacteria bacterium]|nr:GGDEF domain-containing protein [Gammaproteobacteria bacterium]MBU2056457.1 GGDEF domain-containing protein [Gammaproteobacteria bacterium]MBU2173830.1 GGDEF domain-containing protein [Gammaproteobacteria bacterium]MBU2248893.1 GGDEF domain-containing protein [Gammaproteobacteria bacterium]MBU2344015.1 GGDEF domain-containing protein [Gammaproteobacteria bacterium]